MISRREMLVATAAGAVASIHAGRTLAAARSADDVRVAVIGVRGRGAEHLEALGRSVAAICDVDADVLAQRSHEHAERTGREAARYTDYRDLLEKADIDAVSIATPNHTHALIAIAAIEAGKHVYCEKPISHNVWEGRQLVAAAHKHNRVVQCGTQCRSSTSLQEAVAFVRAGEFGAVRYAVGACYKPRKAVATRSEPLPIPSSVDYDLWCGPAEKATLFRDRLHYDWHWDWNTGNGDMGNQGIHQMDIARWFLGEEKLAPRSISIGGRLGYDDAGDTPNTQVVVHDYPSAPLIFETRGLPRSKQAQRAWGDSMDSFRGARVGVVVQCEGGHVLVPSYADAIAFDRSGREVRRWRGGGDHYGNFLEAAAAGDASRLNAEIREGHVSSALCHTGGVSHLVGRRAVAADIAESIASDDLLSQSFERMASHLRANDVDIDAADQALTIGPWLAVDPETERFTDSPAAAALFSRECREPFVVSDYGA